jgi:hypothetical protein
MLVRFKMKKYRVFVIQLLCMMLLLGCIASEEVTKVQDKEQPEGEISQDDSSYVPGQFRETHAGRPINTNDRVTDSESSPILYSPAPPASPTYPSSPVSSRPGDYSSDVYHDEYHASMPVEVGVNPIDKPSNGIAAGQLTAGVINDRDDWQAWLDLESERKEFYDWNLNQITTQAQAPALNIPSNATALDLLFIVDATGSMGDEMSYLKSELKDVIQRVSSLQELTEVRLALVFYRDVGDQYLTRSYDFDTNIESQVQNLSKQNAGGGGDFPEAVHTALEESLVLHWSKDGRKKLAFIVLDAPPHKGDSYASSLNKSLNTYKTNGIQLFPVASSGIDKTTEYFLRNSAIMTGGSYVFLTDHSGIGNSHLAPSADSYTVEYLNDLLVRVISQEVTGVDITPVDYRQK